MNEIIIDALAVLLDKDCSIYQKKAGLLLLKHFLPKEVLQDILEDDQIYPFDRNDKRVAKWRKRVTSKGKCEICGSTEKLEAHHIIKWSEYPAGRIDLKNGMCLCHDCHTKEHQFDECYHMMKAR